MGLVAAKCTQCGANIEVDASKEAGVCAHCGTAFITEKVINNYTIHNHNTVNNNIANATINVKNGDGIGDFLRRYKAFVLQKKYNSAADAVRKMDEKFPDSGITQYCHADMHLSVKGYYGWLNYIENGCNKYKYPVVNDTGVCGEVGNDGKCRVFDAYSRFDGCDELGKDYDELDKLSDDELIERADKNRTVFDDGTKGGICLTDASPICYIGVPVDEEDFDEIAFDNEEDRFYFSGPSHNYYLRAEYCARKSIAAAKVLLTAEERETYKDFISEVEEKYGKFKSIAMRREKAKVRLLALNDRVEKINRKASKGKFRKAKTKKFLKRFIAVAVIAAVVAVAVIVIKKFL